MSALLSRRGFAQLALAAGAGMMLPSIGAAHRGLAARLAAVPHATRLAFDLFLRHEHASALVLVRGVISLEVELSSSLGDHAVTLRPEVRPSRPMSRAAPARRDAAPFVLPPGQELLYSRFSAPWPSELATAHGEASVSARSVLALEPASRPRSERAALFALSRIHATTSVTLPA